MECKKCLHVFVASSEVRGTGSDGLALIQYHAIMAGSAEFANMIKRFSFRLCVVSLQDIDESYGECF